MAFAGTQVALSASVLEWITWARVLSGGSANSFHGDMGLGLLTSMALLDHELYKKGNKKMSDNGRKLLQALICICRNIDQDVKEFMIPEFATIT